MSDPRLFRSPDGIAADIKLQSTYPGHASLTFLIVEGDSDAKFFGKPGLVDHNKCKIIVAQGNQNAQKAFKILESQNFRGVLCILDADFTWLKANPGSSPNLLFTDTHDLETMLLQSPALEKVLAEAGDLEKYKDKDVRTIITKAALPIGHLRWLSIQKQLFLSFEHLVFNQFLEANLTTDGTKLLHHIQEKSPGVSFDIMMLKDELEQSQKNAYDVWQICSGHDLTHILAVGLRKMLGAYKENQKNLESSLRTAYEANYFYQTQLYTAIQEWEKANHPFLVLVKTTP